MSDIRLPNLSVVIPTRNRPEALRDCLQSLTTQTLPAFEALIMDQSDGDATRAVVESFGDSRFRYHRMPRPGACPARNLGAALAASPLVAFLDDDCRARSNWIERIVEAFAQDGELQFIFGQLKAPPHDAALGSYPEYLPDAAWQRRAGRRGVAMVAAGANMSARKSFLLEIGGFDELLGPTQPTVKSNDSSISWKVLRSGAKWQATPEIEVEHTNGFRPHAQLGRLYAEYEHGLGVNYARFFRRGDTYAACAFLRQQFALTTRPLTALARTGKPRGARVWLAHLKGFWDGLTLPSNVGYVDGPALRRMAQTGCLDAEISSSPRA